MTTSGRSATFVGTCARAIAVWCGFLMWRLSTLVTGFA
jgi:hypothetical protein